MVEKASDKQTVTINLEMELDSVDYFEKLGIDAESENVSIDLGSGVTAKIVDVEKGLGFLDPISTTMVVSFAVGVGSGVVANLIYGAIGAGIRRITFNKRRIRPEKEELIRALQTAIDLIQEGNDKG